MKVTLKGARVNAGFTQDEAAEKIAVNTATIQNWESGKTFPNIKQAYALSELYNMPLDNIIFFS